jgi:hypothetical protein
LGTDFIRVERSYLFQKKIPPHRAKPHKKCRLQNRRHFFCAEKLLVFVFALLVRNTAGGLAGRLAGGLAFAASAGSTALLQVAGFNRLNSFHRDNLQSCKMTCLARNPHPKPVAESLDRCLILCTFSISYSVSVVKIPPCVLGVRMVY